MKNAFVLALAVGIACFAITEARGAEDEKKVYGSAFLNAFFEPGQEIHDAVKLRYKCKVLANECVRPEMWKIIFMFHFFETPGSGKTYQLESNLYTWRFLYPHLSKRVVGKEVEGLRNLAGESGLFLSIPDNHKDRRIGARSRHPEMFPTLDQEIDGFKDLWKREQVAQFNLTGKEISIEIARGEIVSDVKGWCVHENLPEGKYRTWTTTASWGDGQFKVDFAMPDECARYFAPARMTQIATEAFFIHPGLFKALFWDVEVQRENQTTWEPILKWKLVEADARPGENTWGMKVTTLDSRLAIEVSNDGTRTYAGKGEILELK